MALPNDRQSLGFISVRSNLEHGYVGGLLLINELARPLEFHCSLPVKPLRTQSILYGPTLDEFLCGEQIARTLLSKAKAKPTLIFTDASAVLALRNLDSTPLAFVDVDGDAEEFWLRPQITPNRLKSFRLEESSVSTLEDFASDATSFQRFWSEYAPRIEISEPFGRIAEALTETNPISKAA
jgi:hypothetical protein